MEVMLKALRSVSKGAGICFLAVKAKTVYRLSPPYTFELDSPPWPVALLESSPMLS